MRVGRQGQSEPAVETDSGDGQNEQAESAVGWWNTPGPDQQWQGAPVHWSPPVGPLLYMLAVQEG